MRIPLPRDKTSSSRSASMIPTGIPADTGKLTRLPGVTAATNSGNGVEPASAVPTTYRLAVSEPRAAVGALPDWSDREDVELRGLEVVPAAWKASCCNSPAASCAID